MSGPAATIFGIDPFWLSSALLLITYGVLVIDRLNRSIVALLGGGLMIVCGVVDQNQAIAGQDFNTLALLIGMMLLVAIARPSGMFQYLAFWCARTARGHPGLLLALLTLVTALVSTMLNNVTTVLLIAPVTLVLAGELRLAPYPFLFSEVIASNIGGTATLIGDPPNILIGSLVGLDFNAFIVHLAPIIIIVMAAQALMIHLLWGKALKSTPARKALVMGMSAKETILDWTLLKQSLVV